MLKLSKICRLLTLILLLSVYSVRNTAAQDLNLNSYARSTFEDFVETTGQILGSGIYHGGGIHGFGGFDFGIKTMVGFIPGEMRDNGPFSKTSRVPIPVFQANIGLFNSIEAGGRLFQFDFGESNKEEVKLVSGIVKLKIMGGPGLPKATVYSSYSRISGIADFSFNTITIGGIIGYEIPVISVYAGGNYNLASMKVSLQEDNGFYPAGLNETIRKRIPHFTLGISLGLAPFTKINAEYNQGKIKTVTIGFIFLVL